MPRRRRQPAKVPAKDAPSWKFVAFGDLHVSAATLDRCLVVLAAIRTAAQEHGAQVVFTGDFWDARGVLSVRQVSALLDEFHQWADIPTIFIPGNHDQVTLDGQIHGIRIFEPFSNISIATDRILWEQERIAFIPWREDSEEQSAMFDLEGGGWTIFAHAEVQGATTNYAHKAPGKIARAKIESVARACYCGHYHKRQLLGDRTWYVGSPYQQTFGEMNDPPKGICLITPEQVEPTWLPLDDMPRHHRVYVGKPSDLSVIREQDIVELYYPPGELDSEGVKELFASLPAQDVRPLPIKSDAEEDEAAPTKVLTLHEAVENYTDDPTLRNLGQAILSELPEASTTAAALFTDVAIMSVEVTDFCAIKGTVRLEFDQKGLILIKGKVGVGKTALVDSITWALYGQTSPRKAGSHKAMFRGDEVVHDGASKCTVQVRLLAAFHEVITITRTKVRGKGARAEIEGVEGYADGVKDFQQIIDRVVGLTYPLWRTCVSLGQGAVGNFVTDADSARKELLSAPFGLDVCPAARKIVSARLSACVRQRDKIDVALQAEQRALQVIDTDSMTAQAAQWDIDTKAELDSLVAQGQAASQAIQTIDEQLVGEAEWLERQKQFRAAIDQYTAAMAGAGPSPQETKLLSEIGAAKAEQSMVEANLGKDRVELDRLRKKFALEASLTCPTCKQPMPTSFTEEYLHDFEIRIENAQRQIGTFNSRIENMGAQLSSLQKSSVNNKAEYEAHIAAAQQSLEKIGQALNAFTRLRAQRDENNRILEKARSTWRHKNEQQNPFTRKAEEMAAKKAEIEAKIAALTAERAEVVSQIAPLEFWDVGFSPKGLPALVISAVLHELELQANKFLGTILNGRVTVRLALHDDSIQLRFFECVGVEEIERRYEQLSGGQRRCVELAFSPFALSEMIFSRSGVDVPFLIVDELTTHLGQAEKPLVCEVLRQLKRTNIVVIDHDVAVQGEFDTVYELTKDDTSKLTRVGL